MGYEFQLSCPLNDNSAEQIFEAISSHDNWDVVERQVTRMYLRFAYLPRYEPWPRDIDLYYDSDTQDLLVAFHRGSYDDQNKLLDFILFLLKQKGLSCTFEED